MAELGFKVLLSLLKDFTLEQKLAYCLIQDKEGKSTLHNYKNFILSYYSFEQSQQNQLRSDHLNRILGIRDFAGNTPLHYPEFFIQAKFVFLEHLTASESIQLLMTPNALGKAPIHDAKIFKEILHWLKDFSQSEHLALLRLKDNNNFTPVHDLEIFKESIDWISELPAKLQIEILSSKNVYGLTPLHNPSILKAAIPLLMLLNSKQQAQLMSIQDNKGNTLLHHASSLKRVIPLLEKFSSIERTSVLSIPDCDGLPPLHFNHNLKKVLPWLKRLEDTNFVELISIRDVNGFTTLYYSQNLLILLSVICSLSFDRLVEILSVRDSKGRTLLHIPEMFYMGNKAGSSSLLDIFSIEQQIQILAIRNSKGEIPLHNVQVFETAIPWIMKQPLNNQINLLSVTLSDGSSVLHNPIIFKKAIRYLEQTSIKLSIALLGCANHANATPLHDPQICADAIPLLKLMSVNERILLLSKKDEWDVTPLQNLSPAKQQKILILADANRNNLLYDDAFYSILNEIINNMPLDQVISLLRYQNDRGNTPLHSHRRGLGSNLPLEVLDELMFIENRNQITPLSMQWTPQISWLLKDKVSNAQQVILSQDLFEQRVFQLLSKVLGLWNALSFGDNEFQILPKKLIHKKLTYSQTDIEIVLGIMLEKILQKEAWIGTPQRDDIQGLHAFYSKMLINFEKIVTNLEIMANPEQTAGVLFDLACVQLDERCASAYQEEIEQAATVFGDEIEQLDFTLKLENRVHMVLRNVVQEVASKGIDFGGGFFGYNGDSHYMGQLNYAVKFSLIPDPLSPIPVDNALANIRQEWTSSRVIRDFQSSIEELSQEDLMDWLKNTTPPNFLPHLVNTRFDIRLEETNLLRKMKELLLSVNINNQILEKIISFLISPRGAFPRFEPRLIKKFKKVVVETPRYNLFNTIEQVLVKEFNREVTAKVLPRSNSLNDRQILIDAVKKPLTWQKIALPIKIIENQIYSRLAFIELMLNETIHLHPHQIEMVLEAKKLFDETVGEMHNRLIKLEISYQPKIHGLPSIAIESERRYRFAAQCFRRDSTKLTGFALTFILEYLNVLSRI